jgi:predicted DNA-binding transcriptional regulator YafY
MKKQREEKVKKLRILEIDQLIREGTYPNADTLGKKFEVSRSTIMRDIDFLRDRYRAPLVYDAAKNGFYYTDSTFFIKSVMLNGGEVFAVSVIRPLLEQYRNTPLETSMNAIIGKLTDLMPSEVSVGTSFMNADISFISDPLPKIDENVFYGIFDALRTKHTMTFQYRSLSSTVYKEHTADPYHIICQKGSWYMLAFCHSHEEILTFALSRMKDIQIRKEKYTIPASFHAEKYFDSSFGVWNNRAAPVKIELLFSKEIGTLILERVWHEKQKLRQEKDGSVYLSFQSNQFQETLHWVMSFGSAVKVLNPPELAEQVKDEAKKMAKMY